MRYRLGEEALKPAQQANDGMLMGTSIYSFLLGLGFIYVGLRVKQRWLAFWGAGLSLASVASWFVVF